MKTCREIVITIPCFCYSKAISEAYTLMAPVLPNRHNQCFSLPKNTEDDFVHSIFKLKTLIWNSWKTPSRSPHGLWLLWDYLPCTQIFSDRAIEKFDRVKWQYTVDKFLFFFFLGSKNRLKATRFTVLCHDTLFNLQYHLQNLPHGWPLFRRCSTADASYLSKHSKLVTIPTIIFSNYSHPFWHVSWLKKWMVCRMSSCQKLKQKDAVRIDIALLCCIPARLASFRGMVPWTIWIFIGLCQSRKAIVCETGLKLCTKKNITRL